jgi:hypothetical protein
LLLALLFLLFLLSQVMSDYAARRGTSNAVMTCDVPGYAADDGTLDATLRRSGFRADEKRDAE